MELGLLLIPTEAGRANQCNLLKGYILTTKLLEDFNLFTNILFSVVSDTFFISKQNGSIFRSSRTDQLTVPVNKLSEITVIVIYGRPLHLELFIILENAITFCILMIWEPSQQNSEHSFITGRPIEMRTTYSYQAFFLSRPLIYIIPCVITLN